MAERKPLSLNERNNRLLQGLYRSSSAKPPPPSEERVHKVKLEGRRRLCKLSSDTPEENPEECWFDSPPKEKEKEEQIRDILNDLTSRLECLSVEKSKAADPRPGPKSFPEPEPEPQEFGSANSSLSPSSLFSGSDAEGDDRRGGGERGKKVEPFNNADGVWERQVSEEEEEECVVLGSSGKSSRREDGAVDEEEELVVLGSGDESSRNDYGDFGVDDDGPGESFFGDEDGECITLHGSGISKSLTYNLPGKIAKILYPHQRDGLMWLWSLHCGATGGILGDDMGLGKTMQISSFLAGLFHSHLIKRVLIVAPKTLLSHWIKELSVVGLARKTKDYFGASAKARHYELCHVLEEGGILLTTYDIVRNNSKSIRGDFHFREDGDEDEIVWDYIILDEGHLIKNPSTQRAKSLLEIPSSHRIVISGTPIQNNLKELWALFNFCCPEILGDKKEFKETYEYKINRGIEKNASDREKHIGSTVAKELRERIKPHFLRRLKSEVFRESDATNSAQLSKKNEIIVWLRLSQCQRQLYEAFLKSEMVHSSFKGSPLAALTILKKICDHPFLLTKRAAEGVLEGMDTMLNREEFTMVEEMALNLAEMTHSEDAQQVDNSVSCKICFLSSLLEMLVMEGHHVLIFSQTRKMLNLIQEEILSKGYMFLRIDGTTKIADREKIVNDFQGGKAPIFLLTSQVGGLGLTLTKADRVIVVDPAWNPSTDNQSVDRAYRIGQKKDVIVYRLMTCGTIEEKIYKMQVFKGGLFKIATEQKEQTRYFSQKDLRELFSLPKEGFDVSLTQQQLQEEHGCQQIMDESLKNHIQFLEKQGIAGVSHHSLLFSKTTPLPFVQEDDDVKRKGNVTVRSSSSYPSVERDVNGGEYAFNPKDGKSSFSNAARVYRDDTNKKPEDIEERIKRLSCTLTDEAVVSKLPDKGDKIRRQIVDLNLELSIIRDLAGNHTATYNSSTIIDLDDLPSAEPEVDLDGLSQDLQRVLSI